MVFTNCMMYATESEIVLLRTVRLVVSIFLWCTMPLAKKHTLWFFPRRAAIFEPIVSLVCLCTFRVAKSLLNCFCAISVSGRTWCSIVVPHFCHFVTNETTTEEPHKQPNGCRSNLGSHHPTVIHMKDFAIT